MILRHHDTSEYTENFETLLMGCEALAPTGTTVPLNAAARVPVVIADCASILRALPRQFFRESTALNMRSPQSAQNCKATQPLFMVSPISIAEKKALCRRDTTIRRMI